MDTANREEELAKRAEVLAKLDAFIAQIEQMKIKADESLQEMEQRKKNFEESIRQMHELRREIAGGDEPAPQTAFERVVTFFRERGNRPHKTSEIRRATGISRGALSLLIYKTHRSEFERLSAPGMSRTKLIRLNEQRLDAPQGESLAGKSAIECGRIILADNNNRPMHVATIAKEALRRGYVGKMKGDPDAVEFRTVQSFWAAIHRSSFFAHQGGGKFVLGSRPPSHEDLFNNDDGWELEEIERESESADGHERPLPR